MRKIYNMHEAKTQFSSLAAMVANGEEVIIARAGEPIMKLVKFTNNRPPIGAYAHEWEGVDIEELLKPWTDEEIQSWIDGPI